jgi:serine/threonine-protein phosphatase 2A regulatory subunit B
LAVGDHAGRVIVFQYSELRNSRYFDYKYFAEFQSHEPDFDHLKSIELNEKINDLEFLYPTRNNATNLLTTNDKIIKLWSIDMKEKKEVKRKAGINSQGSLTFPKLDTVSCLHEGTERRKFIHCHNYSIHALCASAD